ncbi:MAG: outer membrane protein assembly factor BamA [Litorivicinaceae bacterium]|nr:outer membrane protein assembly factor BamA [Litorivicinaceae bacterium]MDP5329465.1 outer membrane protein assembly factor BamA [Litorivicinaceae bacterium]MDP5331059.1 outer membrane protein assembly factor BamA [Litorivicinaceae bacterium]MDP5344210.1 outer membrane protein assembly factor BamA [Litorivicinaceae bacterium]MDP5364422.1 outer membrane protein assembly factor BamA [Litorivicinaceae bacterium]
MRLQAWIGALLLSFYGSAFAATDFVASDIRIEGLQRVSSGSVFEALTLKPGDRVNDQVVSEVTRRLFDTGFFDQVVLRQDGAVLVIDVVERPAVSRIEITGNKAIETDDLIDSLRRAGIAEGDVLKRATLDSLAQAITRQYTSRGRYDAIVTSEIIPQDRNRVGLNITVFEGSVAKIRRITIVGNQSVETDTLLGEIDSTDGGLFTWITGSDQYESERLTADVEAIRSYYLDRGYVNADIAEPKIELSENLEEVFITITVVEGTQYQVGSVNIGGEIPIDLTEAVNALSLQSGELFSRRLVNEAVESMSKALGDAGYGRAQVRAVPELRDEAQAVDVTLVVTPGPLVYVRRIEFRGNTGTSDVVLRREIPQLESAVTSAAQIERGRINLQRLGFFSLVRVQTRPVPDEPDQVDVVYEVTEQASGSLSASIGFSQGEGVLLGAGVSQKNFLGSGNSLSFSLQSSSSVKEARFSFTDPYFTIDGVSRGIDLYFRETDFDEDGTANYTTDETGLGLSFGYPVSDRARLSTSARIQSVVLKTDDNERPDYIENFLVSEGFARGNREAEFLEVVLGAGYSFNTLNKAFLPTEGIRHRVSADLAIPGSDLEYYSLNYLGESFTPLSKTRDLSLAMKTNLGYGSGYGDSDGLPFLKNFFAGGIRSVRGFEYNSLGPRDEDSEQIGGNVLVTGSVSLQFPLPGVKETDQTRISVFTDAGQVYDDEFDPSDLRYSTGVALAWMTPIGPLSFTYAKALNASSTDQTEGFQFSIGSSF